MSRSNVILQSHHVIEQSTFLRSSLLKKLVEHKLVDQDISTNRLYLPVEDDLADELAASPHRGRTLSSYTDRVGDRLQKSLIPPTAVPRCAMTRRP
ncbi:AHH domain-containing protein [Xanthomonas campestris pv. parthenii]|nr:AHH domain-containing protein [Xanthomonas campestris pv. parthenii]